MPYLPPGENGYLPIVGKMTFFSPYLQRSTPKSILAGYKEVGISAIFDAKEIFSDGDQLADFYLMFQNQKNLFACVKRLSQKRFLKTLIS